MKMKVILATTVLLVFGADLFGEVKVDKNVAYGPHERNVMDIYWNTDYKNAPIVFTIHGGSFKFGSKEQWIKHTRKLYMDKGCVVVSPNYRMLGGKGASSIADCVIDAAMAVAYIQANAEKFGGDSTKIVATGRSAGAYLAYSVAYKKNWNWPASAKYKPKKLNVVGVYCDSGAGNFSWIEKNDPPAFMIYGEKEHPQTPASKGFAMQKVLTSKGIWSKMVYVKPGGHTPGTHVLEQESTRNETVFAAFSQFLDMVCYDKGEPKGGDVIEVKKN
ncbi:MAG: hypothetical protein COA78_15130 [Blastopirellula sp.]|nr:MAG: hypothetical protein COA78_15130 [Blastopirellula sp.]